MRGIDGCLNNRASFSKFPKIGPLHRILFLGVKWRKLGQCSFDRWARYVSHCSTVETTGVRPIARWSWTFSFWDGGWGCYNFVFEYSFILTNTVEVLILSLRVRVRDKTNTRVYVYNTRVLVKITWVKELWVSSQSPRGKCQRKLYHRSQGKYRYFSLVYTTSICSTMHNNNLSI